MERRLGFVYTRIAPEKSPGITEPSNKTPKPNQSDLKIDFNIGGW